MGAHRILCGLSACVSVYVCGHGCPEQLIYALACCPPRAGLSPRLELRVSALDVCPAIFVQRWRRFHADEGIAVAVGVLLDKDVRVGRDLLAVLAPNGSHGAARPLPTVALGRGALGRRVQSHALELLCLILHGYLDAIGLGAILYLLLWALLAFVGCTICAAVRMRRRCWLQGLFGCVGIRLGREVQLSALLGGGGLGVQRHGGSKK
jgi:hypothetical protein